MSKKISNKNIPYLTKEKITHKDGIKTDIKLHYFNNIRGRNESIVMLLSYLKLNYTIYLYDWNTWAAEKKKGKTLFNYITLPLLETKKNIFVQSSSILYYLANKYQKKYNINDNANNLILTGISEDIRLKWLEPIFSNKDSDKKNFIQKVIKKIFH